MARGGGGAIYTPVVIGFLNQHDFQAQPLGIIYGPYMRRMVPAWL
jgi:hypothetical protein